MYNCNDEKDDMMKNNISNLFTKIKIIGITLITNGFIGSIKYDDGYSIDDVYGCQNEVDNVQNYWLMKLSMAERMVGR